MRILDLFSGAGGAAMGYHRAGFHVTGVDNRPQPRYPFEFHVGDALEFASAHGHEFDAIHASPPCHDHSKLAARWGKVGTGNLLPETRELLEAAGRPYVIENVEGAPMRPDIILCGEQFGLRTVRHRWFELGRWWAMCPMHVPHSAPTSHAKRTRDWLAGMHTSVTGKVNRAVASVALDIDWMTGPELAQAIPPRYTHWIGERLLAHLKEAAHA